MDAVAILVAGLVAGLAVAVPLGAIGVLLLHEGATRGWTKGAPSAVAVASVDTLYCLLAAVAGSALAPAIAGAGAWPRIVGGALLLAIAARGLLQLRRPRTSSASVVHAERGSSWRRFALFFALTAVNPATLVYFAAIITGLTEIAASPAAIALFTTGVGAASLSWQLLLVLAGSLLHGRVGGRLRGATSLVGNGVVAVLGIILIAGATP